MVMKDVNVAELKRRLSHYLKLVERGETVLVRNRERVVARIEPSGAMSAGERTEGQRLAVLEERGILRTSRKRIDKAFLSRRPRTKANVVEALLREREQGR
jgi:antitoxin (DNA-binding transcriptional repressor) of toxin-antitoxin stability system